MRLARARVDYWTGPVKLRLPAVKGDLCGSAIPSYQNLGNIQSTSVFTTILRQRVTRRCLEGKTEESSIMRKELIFACITIVLSVGAANAGPCNTTGKDAGSGPTPGYTGQTTGMDSAKTPAHPPTDTMNRVAGDKATSSQDAQAQQQGQPTAAQQAQGAQPSSKMADQGC